MKETTLAFLCGMVVFFSVTVCPSFGGQGLGSYSSQEIADIITSKKIRTIEPLLRELSGTHDIVTFNTVTRDPSVFVDADHPRGIVSTDSARAQAKSILAFTGAPGELGWDKLQVLERTTGSEGHRFFSASEFEFPAERGIDRAPVWKQNPPRCLACHSDTRDAAQSYDDEGVMPIWDEGSALPGFVGNSFESFGLSNGSSRSWLNKDRYRVVDFASAMRDTRPFLTGDYAHLKAMTELLEKWNSERLFSFLSSRHDFANRIPVVVSAISDTSNQSFAATAEHFMGYSPQPQTLSRLRRKVRTGLRSYRSDVVKRLVASEHLEEIPDDWQTRLRLLETTLNECSSLSRTDAVARLRWLMSKWGLGHVKLVNVHQDADALMSSDGFLLSALHSKLSEAMTCSSALLTEPRDE